MDRLTQGLARCGSGVRPGDPFKSVGEPASLVVAVQNLQTMRLFQFGKGKSMRMRQVTTNSAISFRWRGGRVLRAPLFALALTGVLAAGGAAPSRADEYKLQPGDIVNVALGNLPELRLKESIDADGKLSLPMVGAFTAAGLTVTQLKDALKAQLNNKLYRQITPEGKENMIVLNGDECNVSVLTYRPVYVNGDVAKPGELEFKPGLTVRRAIAVAGGQDLLKARIGSPLDTFDYRTVLISSATEQLAEELRIARIQAELDGAEPDLGKLGSSFLDVRTVESMKDVERRQFRIRQDGRDKEKAILTEAAASTNQRIGVMRQQLEKESAGEKEDVAELDRAKELVQKGNAPMNRVTDARRTSLFSATRVLQTVSQVNVLERERDDLLAKIAKVDLEARVNLAKDLQEAKVKLLAAKARVDGAQAKLAAGSGSMQLNLDGPPLDPNVTVFRTTGGKEQRMSVALDFVLQPGDALQVDKVPVTPTSN